MTGTARLGNWDTCALAWHRPDIRRCRRLSVGLLAGPALRHILLAIRPDTVGADAPTVALDRRNVAIVRHRLAQARGSCGRGLEASRGVLGQRGFGAQPVFDVAALGAAVLDLHLVRPLADEVGRRRIAIAHQENAPVGSGARRPGSRAAPLTAKTRRRGSGSLPATVEAAPVSVPSAGPAASGPPPRSPGADRPGA